MVAGALTDVELVERWRTTVIVSAGPLLLAGRCFFTVITFVIVAFAIFLLVQQVNRWILKPGAGPKECPFCASMIPVKAKRCPQCTSQLAAA